MTITKRKQEIKFKQQDISGILGSGISILTSSDDTHCCFQTIRKG